MTKIFGLSMMLFALFNLLYCNKLPDKCGLKNHFLKFLHEGSCSWLEKNSKCEDTIVDNKSVCCCLNLETEPEFHKGKCGTKDLLMQYIHANNCSEEEQKHNCANVNIGSKANCCCLRENLTLNCIRQSRCTEQERNDNCESFNIQGHEICCCLKKQKPENEKTLFDRITDWLKKPINK